MRTIKQTGQFKRDLKREAKGPHRKVLQDDFVSIVGTLASDKPLDPKYCDHPLSGDWVCAKDRGRRLMRTEVAALHPGLKLGYHHFALFRGSLDGMSLTVLADRYLEDGAARRSEKSLGMNQHPASMFVIDSPI